MEDADKESGEEASIEAIFRHFTSVNDMSKYFTHDHDGTIKRALNEKWDEFEVRNLHVRVVGAANLPMMDTRVRMTERKPNAYVVSFSVCLRVLVPACA